MSTAKLHDTIRRQAKRLRNHFDIDLTTAKKVLARGPYGCSGWSDLCARLDRGPFDNGPLQLAELPKSPGAAAYLEKNLTPLATSISQQLLTNCNLPALCEALRQIFAVPGNPVTLSEVLQSVTHREWQPADIGPDSHAVIQSRICVNGVEILLLGTRIFWPRLFKFDEQVEAEARTAEPIGDDLKIMWDVAAWHKASRDYLLEYQRGEDWDDLPDFVEPQIAESELMQRHARWFAQCLTSWRQERHYNIEGEEFIPYVYKGHAYLIFGVPTSTSQPPPTQRQQTIHFPGDDSNESQVILLDGQLLRIEILAVPRTANENGWDYADYHQVLCKGLIGGAVVAGWIEAPSSGWGDLLFMSPACQFSIRCQLKVEIKPEPNETLFTLRTDNPELALELLERAGKGQFIRCDHGLFGARYAMRVEQPSGDHSKELSLSLDFIEPNVLQSTHLIHHRISYEDGNVQFLYFEIDPKLIKLVGRQPLKVLKKAVLEGLVIRADGLREQLDEPFSEPPGKTPEQAEEWVFSPPEDAEFNTDDIIEVGTIRFKRNNY